MISELARSLITLCGIPLAAAKSAQQLSRLSCTSKMTKVGFSVNLPGLGELI